MNKTLGKRIVTIALSLVLGLTIFIGASVSAFAYKQTTGKVTSDNVKVRASASTTASQVSSLKKGDVIDIVDESQDASGNTWYKIFVNKSEYGWVRSDLVTKAGDSEAKPATSTTSNTQKENGSAASLPATTVTATEQKVATVTSESVNVRQGAGTAYDSVGKVTKGETVTITGEATGTDNKTWYQITFGANGKTGFVRGDLVAVGEAAPAETPEGGEGETPEGAEGETPEGGDGEDTPAEEQSTPASDAGDGTYTLLYVTEEEGTGTWYLYDNVEGFRVKVKEVLEAAKNSEKVPKLAKENKLNKTIMIILGFLVAALAAICVYLVFRLRDSLYYEDEDEEEEYDRYSQNKRAPRDDAENDRFASRRKERAVKDEADEEGSLSSRRAADRRAARDDRDDRRQADDRPSFRRPAGDRTVRPERDAQDRAFRRQEEPERPVREAAPKRKTRNFIGDEDDFEFEFLDLDDEK